MTGHFNKLTPAQAERLALIAEEAGEVVQAVTKILRHGYDNFHPDTPNKTNKDDLEKEIGDFIAVVDMAAGCGDLDEFHIGECRACKGPTTLPYLHHQSATEDRAKRRKGFVPVEEFDVHGDR